MDAGVSGGVGVTGWIDAVDAILSEVVPGSSTVYRARIMQRWKGEGFQWKSMCSVWI